MFLSLLCLDKAATVQSYHPTKTLSIFSFLSPVWSEKALRTMQSTREATNRSFNVQTVKWKAWESRHHRLLSRPVIGRRALWPVMTRWMPRTMAIVLASTSMAQCDGAIAIFRSTAYRLPELKCLMLAWRLQRSSIDRIQLGWAVDRDLPRLARSFTVTSPKLRSSERTHDVAKFAPDRTNRPPPLPPPPPISLSSFGLLNAAASEASSTSVALKGPEPASDDAHFTQLQVFIFYA